MCDACHCKGTDWKFINGEKEKLEKARFFRVFKGKISVVKLCHYHTIKLFQMGEAQFLQAEIELCREMAQNQKKYAISSG